MRSLNLFFIFSLTVFFSYSSCGQMQQHNPQFLEGLWKIENKNTYESWKKTNEGNYIGEAYKLIDGEKQITETLSIKVTEEGITYFANVPTQNGGRTIPFKLNTLIEDKASFENLAHDFPKKIQYQLINESKLLVRVLGDGDEGFSYYLLKQ